MKLLFVTIVIFAAIHYGQANDTACTLADNMDKNMEMFWKLKCNEYLDSDEDEFNPPVSREWLGYTYFC